VRAAHSGADRPARRLARAPTRLGRDGARIRRRRRRPQTHREARRAGRLAACGDGREARAGGAHVNRRVRLFLRLALFFRLPLLLTPVWATAFVESGPHVSDFWTFWAAGRDVLHGRSPYPTIASLPAVPGPKFAPFVYPPSTAFLLAPVAVLP